ncbi:MAG: hypothetical protein ACO3K7_03535 [Candidatus Marinamargulisbacteria bacterium]
MTQKLPTIMKLILFLGIALLTGLFLNNQSNPSFFLNYLGVFSFFISASIGATFLILLMYLTRGGWGVVIKRVPEHLMSLLPIFALLFIPLLFGLDYIFEWLDPAVVAKDYLIQKKIAYLNLPFFIIRNIFYFLVFSVVGFYYWQKSVEQDHATPENAKKITSSLQRKSPVALLLMSIATSFASFDWLMSLYPHWFSTIFGVYYFAGCMVFCLAITIIVYEGLKLLTPIGNYPNVEHFHDLSKLLYGFLIFWAYVSFSQYFLTWYANIPEFTQWYYPRIKGEWESLFYLLIVLHFILPLFGFMSRHIKRNRIGRIGFSVLVIIVHYWDVRFTIYPNVTKVDQMVANEWLLLLAFTAILAPIIYFKIKNHSLIPGNDPRLSESKHLENAL